MPFNLYYPLPQKMKTSDPRKQQLQCGSKTLYGTHAYNLETANFDKIASKA